MGDLRGQSFQGRRRLPKTIVAGRMTSFLPADRSLLRFLNSLEVPLVPLTTRFLYYAAPSLEGDGELFTCGEATQFHKVYLICMSH